MTSLREFLDQEATMARELFLEEGVFYPLFIGADATGCRYVVATVGANALAAVAIRDLFKKEAVLRYVLVSEALMAINEREKFEAVVLTAYDVDGNTMVAYMPIGRTPALTLGPVKVMEEMLATGTFANLLSTEQ